MQRRFIVGVVAFTILSGLTFAWLGFQNYGYAFTPEQKAAELLTRAEAAQSPKEVIEYVNLAKQEMPESGPVSWFSDRGDFESIQAKLDGIILRAENILSLSAYDQTYVSEMNDIHSKLDSITEVLVAF